MCLPMFCLVVEFGIKNETMLSWGPCFLCLHEVVMYSDVKMFMLIVLNLFWFAGAMFDLVICSSN